MDVDTAMSSLGRFGRWQVIKYCLVCLSVTVSGCWHMMVIVFTGWEPDHHCRIPEGALKNETIPMELQRNGKMEYSTCNKYANFSLGNTTIACDDGWDYAKDFDSTIVMEWDLVCDKNYLVETSQSMFNFGVCLGASLFTTLADKIGRKPVHLGCQYAMIVVGFAIAFAPNYILFVILRFLLGAFREGAGLTGIVMACELFPAAQRTFAGTALELFWASAWMVLALIAYFIRDWRHLQLTVSLIPLLTIVLIWLLPESVPWLVSNNKIKKAEKIMHKAAKFNGVKLPEKIFKRPHGDESACEKDTIKNNEQNGVVTTPTDDTNGALNHQPEKTDVNGKENTPIQVAKGTPEETRANEHAQEPDASTRLLKSREQRKSVIASVIENFRKPDNKTGEVHVYTCLDILRCKWLVLYTAIMCSSWFAIGVVYYGLSLSTSTMAGDKYVNFMLSGAVEAPAYMLTIFVLDKFGRRWPLCIFHCVAGIVLFANVFIPEQTASGVSLVPLITTLTMLGKFAITAAFGTVVLYAPELYPTNLRNMGFGLASVFGRLGSMLAPFSSYIGKIVPWVPGVVFTIVTITTGIAALFLPETLNRPLPDTIDEIVAWRHIPVTWKLKRTPEGKKAASDVIRCNDKQEKDETAV